jgi:hypothetical protein
VLLILDIINTLGITIGLTKGDNIMYSYQAITKDGGTVLGPRMKRISDLKSRYFRHLELFNHDVKEIVVLKGRKIHGYYTPDFKLDNSKPAWLHNIIYVM